MTAALRGAVARYCAIAAGPGRPALALMGVARLRAVAVFQLQLRASLSANVQGQPHDRCDPAECASCGSLAPGDELRKLMRRVPAPIAIVTAANARGEVRGIIASSFQSVSIRPPLVSFNLMANNSMHALLDAGGATGFSASVLAEDGRDAADRFANWRALAAALAPPGTPPAALRHPGTAAQLRGLPHRTEALTGAPVLTAGVLGAVHCRTNAIYPVGDHVLVIGEVLRVDTPQGPGHCSPLVWCGGAFRHVGPRIPDRAAPAAAAAGAAGPKGA